MFFYTDFVPSVCQFKSRKAHVIEGPNTLMNICLYEICIYDICIYELEERQS